MTHADSTHRQILKRIARQAMIDFGFEPDFPADAEAELLRLQAVPLPTGAAVRDLRDRLWCSIDNDDTRDVDQL
ncbi:MAG TPA: hypothetical protein VIC33_09225, partial [Vicinamibacterales bacterium]